MEYRRRGPWKGQDPDIFDIALDPLFKVGAERKKIRHVSAAELMWRKRFKDALDGDFNSMKAIIKMIKLNREFSQGRKALDRPDLNFGSSAGEWLNDHSDAAMLILGMATRVLTPMYHKIQAFLGKDNPQPKAWNRYYERWVFEAALDRLGMPPHAIESYNLNFIPAEAEIDPFVFEESEYYKPRASKRSPEETRFRKGTSGNPKGRPPKPAPDGPFDEFFNEKVEIKISGKSYRVTRLEGLLHKADLMAINGDTRILGLLHDTYMTEHCKRWKLKEDSKPTPIVYDTGETAYDTLATSLWARKLRSLDLISRGTKHKVLFKPWIIEMALVRLGHRRLTIEEQREIVRSTSKRRTVQWPDWWEVKPWLGKDSIK